MKKQMATKVGSGMPNTVSWARSPTTARISWKSTVGTPCRCRAQKRAKPPTTKPKSPMRLTMKAFMPAMAFSVSVNQKPIKRYEQSPTPSQPMNIMNRLAPMTSVSMAQTNRLR
jgi:hypothetical protein